MSGLEDRDGAAAAVDADNVTVAEASGSVAGSDDGGEPELACDDRAVAGGVNDLCFNGAGA